MNTEHQFDPNIPAPDETQGFELKDTVSWVINFVFKVGAGYLAKIIIDALF